VKWPNFLKNLKDSTKAILSCCDNEKKHELYLPKNLGCKGNLHQICIRLKEVKSQLKRLVILKTN
jgi:hypothetical protein